MAAIIIQKADVFQNLNASVSVADRKAIVEIMAYMNQNLSKKFSLIDLSAEAYMSVSKFKYVFKTVVGQSFSEYMTQKRMEYACELLSYSNLYIAEIADLVGYKNSGSFSAHFKKYMGILPNNYRLNRADILTCAD